MNFCILSELEFDEFSKNCEQANFLQTVEWGNLRKIYGTKVYYLGVKQDNKVIAATMLMESGKFLSKRFFYAPRGFLIDYNDKKLLKFFTDEITMFAKKHNGMSIRIDPNVLYQERDINGNQIEGNFKNDIAINNLKELGYIHSGFTLDIGSAQSRWNFRLSLDIPYDELKKKFSKSTRKNIEATYNKGLRVRRAKLDDLESVEDILYKTAERKNFKARDLVYYTNMFKTLKDGVVIYIAYLDPDIYIDSINNLLKDELENKNVIIDKMEKDLVGSRLKNNLETSNKLIDKYKNELEEAKQFKIDNPNGLDIGALVSLKSGDEYLTLYSGILMEYKKFTPKYLMYNEHIKDAYKFGFKYIDFYGITGHFNKDDKDYGMYEFKRGFGGNVVEMIGEFTLPTSQFYNFYNFLRSLKRYVK